MTLTQFALIARAQGWCITSRLQPKPDLVMKAESDCYFNSSGAKYILGIFRICLHFISSFNTDMSRVIQVPSFEWQGNSYLIQSVSHWLGYVRSQGISKHVIDWFWPGHFGFSRRSIDLLDPVIPLILAIVFWSNWLLLAPCYQAFFIPVASMKLKGRYTGFTFFRPSVRPSVHLSARPSVCLWTESCPLCIFNNTHRIHFIFAHLI